MKKHYELDNENKIIVTADTERITDNGIKGEWFDFPDDFDFNKQHFYKIINGELIEDTEAIAAELSEQIRNERDALLKQCDFTVLPDSPFTDEQRTMWIEYRQALRDIPQQEGFPFDVTFPEIPE